MIKTENIKDRIEKGNLLADQVAKYLNYRFGYNSQKCSLEEDRN